MIVRTLQNKKLALYAGLLFMKTLYIQTTYNFPGATECDGIY